MVGPWKRCHFPAPVVITLLLAWVPDATSQIPPEGCTIPDAVIFAAVPYPPLSLEGAHFDLPLFLQDFRLSVDALTHYFAIAVTSYANSRGLAFLFQPLFPREASCALTHRTPAVW